MTVENATTGFYTKLRSLEPIGRRMLVEAALILPLVALALHLFGFQRVYSSINWMAQHSHRKTPQDPQPYARKARHLMRYLRRNGPFRGNCLSRSLVLWYLLQRVGVQSDLQIGVRTEKGQFLAHAWVEYQGYPLNAPEGVRDLYAAFDKAIQPKGTWFQ